jgi:hypothetical protein
MVRAEYDENVRVLMASPLTDIERRRAIEAERRKLMHRLAKVIE